MFKSIDVARDALQHAIHCTASNYRNESGRGAVAIARRIGANEGTLSNKCVARVSDHQMTLNEAILVMREANDFRILRTLCSLLDHVPHPLPDFDRCSDVELLSLWAESLEKQGHHAHTVKTALDDGVITVAEIQSVKASLEVAMGAGLAFVARLEGLVRHE